MNRTDGMPSGKMRCRAWAWRQAWLVALLVSITAGPGFGQPIQLDGYFPEWQNLPVLYDDGMVPNSTRIDFGKIRAANDQSNFYLQFEVGSEEILLQNSNALTLYLDTDNDAATGLQINGLGAELEWRFGDRRGTVYLGGATAPVTHIDVGLVTAPTVSSAVYEIALDLQANPKGEGTLFAGDSVRILLRDQSADGDQAPDTGAAMIYPLDRQTPHEITVRSIRKAVPSWLRLMSWNVERDNLFDPAKQAHFTNLLRAIRPDIIGFEEIYSHTAADVQATVEASLPSGPGQTWHVSRVAPDIFVASRYAVLETHAIDGNGAFLLDLRPNFDGELLLIVAHTPCCAKDAERQQEIDALMGFIREAKAGTDSPALQQGMPIIITGDLNLVGESQQLHTLLTGDIVNTGLFGNSFTPDWDGSDFTDLAPRHAASSMYFTWYSPTSTFNPGRLDFMIYSDSVIEPRNSYVLFTPDLPADSLAALGIGQFDSIEASDHQPVVFDFSVKTSTGGVGSAPGSAPSRLRLEQNYPNPFNAGTRIRFSLLTAADVRLAIFDLAGRQVRLLRSGRLRAGVHTAFWSGVADRGETVASGIYILRLETAGERRDRKLLLVK